MKVINNIFIVFRKLSKFKKHFHSTPNMYYYNKLPLQKLYF